MKKKSSSTVQLQEAVKQLEAFALKTEKEASSPVSKTIGLMRSFLINNFQDQSEVRKAVELINRQRLFIQQLQHGDKADKELAQAVDRAVTAYNQHCKKLKSENKGLAKLFSVKKMNEQKGLPNIELPQTSTIKCHYPAKIPTLSAKHSLSTSTPLSKQSKELFQMKVLALLERYGIASNPEARAQVKQAPILTAKQDESSTYMLSQTLTLFPGQTIIVMGSSKLDDKTQTINNLFPETFSISLESTQTGFPHPLQRTGWALANQLLPDYPQRPDLLEEAARIFNLKRQTMAGLSPGGVLVENCKRMLKHKKQVFYAHRHDLLALHLQLATTIVKAANIRKNTFVDVFFNTLHNCPSCYEWLSETYHCMRDFFISKPHGNLLDAVLLGKDTEFGSHEPNVRFSAAKTILKNSIEHSKMTLESLIRESMDGQELAKWQFVKSLGEAIGNASTTIMLQYLSEDLIFSPPTLSSFERSLQACAYAHVVDFHTELFHNAIDHEQVYHMLKTQLENDINRFQKHEFPVVDELSGYFHHRYDSLVKDEG